MRWKLIQFLLLLFLSQSMFAQLGFTEREIIVEQGNYYQRKVENNSIILYYKNSIKNDFGKMISEMISYHIDAKSKICNRVMFATAKSAINRYINVLNSMGIKEDKDKWVDYKNRSVYILHQDGNFVGINHYYLENDPENTVSQKQLFLEKKIVECEKENQQISTENKGLQLEKQELINQRDKLTLLIVDGAKNLEKSLRALKEKDEKIDHLQKTIVKKDSIVDEYIKSIKNTRN